MASDAQPLIDLTKFMPSGAELFKFGPELLLTIVGTLIMVLEGLLREGKPRHSLNTLALLSLGAALGLSIAAYTPEAVPSFQNMLLVDGFGTFFRSLVIVVALLAVLCSGSYLRREHAEGGEYYALILFSVVGQCIMVTANELIMTFIGLEISSIATYILAGYLRDDKRNNESAVKYFLLGSFATAFLLYGVAWIYGLTGTTNLMEIRDLLATNRLGTPMPLVGAAAALMFVGFAFKVSVAPFQVWAPDVYQGAPAPVSAFMSAGPKAAAFAIFVRTFYTAFGTISDRWEPLVWICALLTMLIGNFAALRQNNIKRMLAYSSIAHAGYVMVAITAHSNIGVQAVMFYLAAYAFMNVGAFAVVTHFSRQGERYLSIDDFSGLSMRQPGTAALLSLFMLSLIGVPLTGGFFGKFYVFQAALSSNLVGLTILGLLNSAVAAYYYLRVIAVMYMREPVEATITAPPLSAGVRAAAWISALATLILGIFPGLLLSFASQVGLLQK